MFPRRVEDTSDRSSQAIRYVPIRRCSYKYQGGCTWCSWQGLARRKSPTGRPGFFQHRQIYWLCGSCGWHWFARCMRCRCLPPTGIYPPDTTLSRLSRRGRHLLFRIWRWTDTVDLRWTCRCCCYRYTRYRVDREVLLSQRHRYQHRWFSKKQGLKKNKNDKTVMRSVVWVGLYVIN